MPKLRRAVAWIIDFGLVIAAASLLAVLTFHRISALVTDVPELATRGGFDLLTSRGDVVDASTDLGLSLWDKVVLDVEEAFAALVVVTFLYQWACLALLGRTVGKGLLGLRVTPRLSRHAARRAAVTTAADVAVYAVACVLLIEGQFALSVLVWALAVALFLVNAVPVLLPGRRSLADRLSGTSVTGLGLGAPTAVEPDPATPTRSW
ncbi:RDD family protein [Streptomyces sp. HUAS TT20]|uniref:RDD family protein n=1 Tax=Streptomyces sp. HUAS TT20 TaxID=3447509 RepID=UPI0021D85536|nr:RDD family protein [Streptomyces sp. HUAS 15-9]UXY27127.1 RDD family protein [Streptomyces sp. HUAS 15-9]